MDWESKNTAGICVDGLRLGIEMVRKRTRFPTSPDLPYGKETPENSQGARKSCRGKELAALWLLE